MMTAHCNETFPLDVKVLAVKTYAGEVVDPGFPF
jgi:hypothetical protein